MEGASSGGLANDRNLGFISYFDPDASAAGERFVWAVNNATFAADLYFMSVGVVLVAFDRNDGIAIARFGIGANDVLVDMNKAFHGSRENSNYRVPTPQLGWELN